MQLSSRDFGSNDRIPNRYTCDGGNAVPPLEWADVPPNARSLAIVCTDPDAPSGTFYHWAVYDLPPDARRLPEQAPDRAHMGLREAVNDFSKPGWRGPCPPRGHGLHHYRFRLYALDVPTLGLGGKAGCRDVERLARQHAVAEAELMGVYGR